MKAILLALATLGAAVSAQAGSIVLETNNSLYPIPAPGLSCTAMKAGRTVPDLSAPHVSISELYVTNNTNMNFYPTRLTFRTSKRYACTYTGQVMRDLGLAQNIRPGERAQTFCNMICGAVPFGEAAKMGYLTVYGHTSDGQIMEARAEIQVMN